MGEKIAETTDIFQIVFVVEDLETTLSNWIKYVDFNTASIKHSSTKEAIERGVCVKTTYKGNPVQYYIKVARFDLGGVDFKFVEPENKNGGDPYSDFLKAHGPGIHHLNIGVNNREEVIGKYGELGFPVYAECRCGDTDSTLFDFREAMGYVLELSNKVVGPLAPRDENGNTI